MIERELSRIPIDDIAPNFAQYRQSFDEASIAELAASLQGKQPIHSLVVYPWHFGEGGHSLLFFIIAGERRYRAAKMAGLTEIDCVVRFDLKDKYPDDPEILELSALENIQREELNPIEKGEMLVDYREKTGLTQQQLANKWGKEQVWISRYESLTKLSLFIMNSIKAGMLEHTIGFHLATIEDKSKQDKVLQAMTELGMVNVATASKVAKPANLVPADTDFKQLVKEYGRPSKTSKEAPSQEVASEKLINDIVNFYRRIEKVNPNDIPSNKLLRIGHELSQVSASINRLQQVLGTEPEKHRKSCAYCNKESQTSRDEGWLTIFRFETGKSYNYWFCCDDHLSKWLNREQKQIVAPEPKPQIEVVEVAPDKRKDAIDALVSLHISRREAIKLVDKFADNRLSVEDIVKKALQDYCR